MYTENVKRAIELQTEINKQIEKFEEAQTELVDELENLCDTLNSHECELLMEWYDSTRNHKMDYYIQMEIDFLEEQEGKEAVLAQWDI